MFGENGKNLRARVARGGDKHFVRRVYVVLRNLQEKSVFFC